MGQQTRALPKLDSNQAACMEISALPGCLFSPCHCTPLSVCVRGGESDINVDPWSSELRALPLYATSVTVSIVSTTR